MICTNLDKLNIKVSRLGFGCMRLPLTAGGKIDRELSGQMIDLAYTEGVNYFDTAYGYLYGESELFIGEALKRYPRDSFYLADKLPTWLLKTPQDPDRLFAEQLGKTQVDYFDFYLLHSLNDGNWNNVKNTGALDRMLQMKKEGRIRALGFSYHGDFKTFREVVDAADWDFAQLQINYLDYTMSDAKSFHDLLCQKDIPCVIMEPVRGGMLANLPQDAQGELDACGQGSAASWALRWCLNLENTPVILSGMSTMDQVRDNLDTFSAPSFLTATQLDAVHKTRDVLLAKSMVPCTSCQYCVPCPFGVDIPWVFGCYNQGEMTGQKKLMLQEYTTGFNSSAGADKCTQCGACVPRCPQEIPIPDRLAQAHREILTW